MNRIGASSALDRSGYARLVVVGSRREFGAALTPRIAARSAALPDIHRDPIDRVIIASAIDYDELLTRDGMIARYPGVRVRWDL